MRCLAALAAFLLLSFLPALGQQTPPGPDTLGSRPSNPQAGDIHQAPSTSTDQNQQMTGTEGSTTGYAGQPAFAGSPPNAARSVQGHNPSTQAVTKGKKKQAQRKNGLKPHHAKRQAKKPTARKPVAPPPATHEQLFQPGDQFHTVLRLWKA